MKGRDALLALCATLIAAGFRFALFNLVEFKGDEAWALSLAKQAFEAGRLPQIGLISSVGIANPPVFIWLTMIPYAVSTSALVATGFVALLSTASVYLTYTLSRRLMSPLYAFCAALLFATNPWAVIYSRKLWAQDFLPFFSLVALWALVRLGTVQRSRAGLLLFPALCVQWQLHQSGYASCLSGAIGLLLVYRRGWLHWPSMAVGFVSGLGLLVPYVQYLHQTDWADAKATVAIMRGEREGAAPEPPRERNGLRPLELLGDVSTARGYEYNIGPYRERLRNEAPLLAEALGTPGRYGEHLVAAALLALLVLGLSRLRRLDAPPFVDGTRALPPLVLLVWCLTPVAVYAWARFPLYPHYMIITFPVVYVGLAALCYLLSRALETAVALVWPQHRDKPFGAVSAAAPVALALTWAGFLVWMAGPLMHDMGFRGDYGVAYGPKQSLAVAVARHWPAEGREPAFANAAALSDMNWLLQRAVEEREGPAVPPRLTHWEIFGLYFSPVPAQSGCKKLYAAGPLAACGR